MRNSGGGAASTQPRRRPDLNRGWRFTVGPPAGQDRAKPGANRAMSAGAGSRVCMERSAGIYTSALPTGINQGPPARPLRDGWDCADP
jgi:hypothetical protein